MTIAIQAQPLLVYLLASLRVLAWLFVVPPFSNRSIPSTAKVILALGLTLAVSPSMMAAGAPTGAGELFIVALTQVMVGLALGFVTQMLLGAVAAAGSLIDVFGGFSLAQGFDPMGLQMNTVFGKFHQMLAVMLLFASGGHLLIIGGLLKTFQSLPLGESPSLDGGPDKLIEAFSVFFLTAIQIALPMIAVLFIADLGLALLTKVAPQMNAMNVMFPAKIGLVLLLVGLSFPVLPGAMDRLVGLVNQAAAAMTGGG